MDRQDNKLLLSEELLLSVSQANPLYTYTFNDSILGRRGALRSIIMHLPPASNKSPLTRSKTRN